MFTDSNNTSEPILAIQGLQVDVLDAVSGLYKRVVSDVDLCLNPGMALAMTGRSGGGKSTLALALTGLLPKSARIAAQQWTMFGEDLIPSSSSGDSALGNISVNRILEVGRSRRFLISQDVRSALIPYRTVKWHLQRATSPHVKVSTASLVSQLRDVGFGRPHDYLNRLPHELSAGECQRIQFAMALRLKPDLLIADEPWASVDLELRSELVQQLFQLRDAGTSLILISHDLGLLRELTDDIVVICNGLIAEAGPVKDVLDENTSSHPHTKLLLELSRRDRYVSDKVAPDNQTRGAVNCIFANACNQVDGHDCVREFPTVHGSKSSHWYRCERTISNRDQQKGLIADELYELNKSVSQPSSFKEHNEILLNVSDLGVHLNNRWVFRGWTLFAGRRERIGLCAPSGSGKTTLARILMGLTEGGEGTIVRFPQENPDWTGIGTLPARKKLWKHLQLVHQDTDMTFDPASLVGETLVQIYRANFPELGREAAWDLAGLLFSGFHLSREALFAPPHQLSGGERRRAALARALAAAGYRHLDKPDGRDRILILDEPSVGIDLFLQAVVAEQLLIAQEQLGLTYIVISHDKDFLTRFCQRIYQLESCSAANELCLQDPIPELEQ